MSSSDASNTNNHFDEDTFDVSTSSPIVASSPSAGVDVRGDDGNNPPHVTTNPAPPIPVPNLSASSRRTVNYTGEPRVVTRQSDSTQQTHPPLSTHHLPMGNNTPLVNTSDVYQNTSQFQGVNPRPQLLLTANTLSTVASTNASTIPIVPRSTPSPATAFIQNYETPPSSIPSDEVVQDQTGVHSSVDESTLWMESNRSNNRFEQRRRQDSQLSTVSFHPPIASSDLMKTHEFHDDSEVVEPSSSVPRRHVQDYDSSGPDRRQTSYPNLSTARRPIVINQPLPRSTSTVKVERVKFIEREHLLPSFDFPKHDMIYRDIVTYADEHKPSLIRQTVSNLQTFLNNKTIVPVLNKGYSSPLTRTQEHEVGKQLVDNVGGCLKSASFIGEESNLKTIVEVDFPLQQATAMFTKYVQEHKSQIQQLMDSNEALIDSYDMLHPSTLEECMHFAQMEFRASLRDLEYQRDEIIETIDQEAREEIHTNKSFNDLSNIMKTLEASKLSKELQPLSPELRRINTVIAETHEAMQNAAHEEYHRRNSAVNQVHRLTTDQTRHEQAIKRLSERLESFTQTIQGVNLLLDTIQIKLIDGLEAPDALAPLRKSLSGDAKIPAINTIIKAPYITRNLPGLYALLKERFYDPTIVDFIHTLQTLLKFRMSSNNLELGVAEMDSIINTFHRMGFWERFMTEDKLFTIVLIQAIQADRVRLDVMEHILNTAAKDEASDSQDVEPLYSQLKAYLHTKHTTEGMLQRNNGNNSNNTNQYNNRGANTNNKNRNNQSTIVDYSNAATDDSKPSTAGGGGNQTQSTVRLLTASHNFANAVGPNANFFVLANKRYTATCAVCPSCHFNPKSGNVRQPSHSPKCLNSKCSRCDLYGHFTEDCHQKIPEGCRSNIDSNKQNNNNNKHNSSQL